MEMAEQGRAHGAPSPSTSPYHPPVWWDPLKEDLYQPMRERLTRISIVPSPQLVARPLHEFDRLVLNEAIPEGVPFEPAAPAATRAPALRPDRSRSIDVDYEQVLAKGIRTRAVASSSGQAHLQVPLAVQAAQNAFSMTPRAYE